jgi:hypothetical protein
MDTPSQNAILRCSFCNKSQHDVKKLIAGPSVYICDECVDICFDILSEPRKDAPPETEPRGELSETVEDPCTAQLGVIVSCSLCHMSMPSEDGLAIDSRGLLCPGCVGAIEAAIAVSREPGELKPR